MQIEYVLLANFLINLLVIKTTATLLKERGRLYFLSAFMGACFAVLSPYFYLNNIGRVVFALSSAVWYVCISFKFKTLKKFVQIYGLYIFATLFYGGACFAFANFVPIKSILMLLSTLIVLYMIVQFAFRKVLHKEHVEKFCYDIEIENDGEVTKWKAFLDSGNLLYDPLTQNPVCLVNFKVFEAIFRQISIEDVLMKTDKIKKIKFAHYIAFNTLNNRDKILVFQVDKMTINGREVEKTTLGLVLKNFNQAFGSDVILHNNFAFGG